MKKKTCSTTRLSQKVYKRDLYSHVFSNPVYLSGFAKRYLQDFLATVLFEASSVRDQSVLFFLMMLLVQKTPKKLQ